VAILTAEERVGTVLGGRYRLDAILGAGGTSTVYRAVHTFTNRPVALKVLKPEHSRDRGLVARFLQEARLAATASHPHVVAILDMGTDEDCTFLAMELLEGESLAERLDRVCRLEANVAIDLLRPMMEAIVVAHDKGIIHRDLKPDNVLVSDRGDGIERAVLLDFGMAKTREAAWGHMTQSGVLVGTPFFMSPEQAEGADDLGPATDVWSMGVLLYRALSGELPFHAGTPTALLLAIARGEHVSLSARQPSLSPAIAAWVEGALVVDRSKRYPDMRAMLEALDAARRGEVRVITTSGFHAIGAPSAEPETADVALPIEGELSKRPSPRVALAASVAVVMTLVAAWVLATRETPAEAPMVPAESEVALTGSEQPPPARVPAEVETGAVLAPAEAGTPPTPSVTPPVSAEPSDEGPNLVSTSEPGPSTAQRRRPPRVRGTPATGSAASPTSTGSGGSPAASGQRSTGLVTAW